MISSSLDVTPIPEEKSLIQNAFDLMTRAEKFILKGEFRLGINELVLGLNQIKNSASLSQWDLFSRVLFKEHSLVDVVYQDPCTYYSCQKPRGYAGDPFLLDYIYGYNEYPSSTTELGKKYSFMLLHDEDNNRSAGFSVNSRKDMIAGIIDEVTQNLGSAPKILSVASGHVREVDKSIAIQEDSVGELIALDQDPLTSDFIKANLADYRVTPVCARITDLVMDKLSFSNMDLIYVPGLYDYLPLRVAKRLTSKLFGMLGSGSTLLIANFMPNCHTIGYMETFMQWFLIYRRPHEFDLVTGEINPEELKNKEIFLGDHGNIVFIKLVKG